MSPALPKPRLTRAGVPLTREIEIVDAAGERRTIEIPAERPLALYVDRREIVTLMTLGQAPELLVLGYLLNQGLVAELSQVESVTVDWSVEAAAVATRGGLPEIEARTARRIVTTGCGQGTVFGQMLAEFDALRLPGPEALRVDHETLFAVSEAMRAEPGIYRRAGSVHGSALFEGTRLRVFVEDVGRHNAVDTIAGWMAMHDVCGDGHLMVTTGRMTSEMVIKAARLGVAILVSRNGITAMGHELARRLGMTLIGRASGRRFLCYCGAERIAFETLARTDETR